MSHNNVNTRDLDIVWQDAFRYILTVVAVNQLDHCSVSVNQCHCRIDEPYGA